MTKKLNFKNKVYLIDETDDENETVDWKDETQTIKYFDCGCCDECLCDDSTSCKNCGCNCNGDDYDEEYSDDLDEESEDYVNEENLKNFDINIIESNDNEKKVRITLELNLDTKKNEVISIDLDINSSTYLKIAEELFKS